MGSISEVHVSDGLYWQGGELVVRGMFGWSGDIECTCNSCGVTFDIYDTQPGSSQA
jgi:hypothetical protein